MGIAERHLSGSLALRQRGPNDPSGVRHGRRTPTRIGNMKVSSQVRRAWLLVPCRLPSVAVRGRRKSSAPTTRDNGSDATGDGRVVANERTMARADPRITHLVAPCVTDSLRVRVVWDPHAPAHVFSPFAGRVERVAAPVGLRVKAGGDVRAGTAAPSCGGAQADADRAKGDISILSHCCRAVEVRAECAKPRRRVAAGTSHGRAGRCRMAARRFAGLARCIASCDAELAHFWSGDAPISPDREIARDSIPRRAHLHET